ncbi:MAG: YbhB/YbcL family Raf kinase inhibitor-like protein [Chloroflexota bacterium]
MVASRRRLLWLALLAAFVASCSGTVTTPPGSSASPTAAAVPSGSTPSAAESLPSPTMSPEPPDASSGALTLTSSAFQANAEIPADYTCKGADRSPDLAWTGVPAGTNAFVLFVDDPDGRDWVHWSVLDVAPTTSELPAGLAPTADPPQQGTNDFGNVGYGGPCPPSGTHHYQFTLYALAAPLGLKDHPKGDAVRSALEKAQVLEKVTLVGTFSK